MELSNLGLELFAVGAISGYFAGYLIKKLMHLAFTIGIFACIFMYMSYTNAIDLNLEEISATLGAYAELLLERLELGALLANAPFASSFVIGLVFAITRY